MSPATSAPNTRSLSIELLGLGLADGSPWSVGPTLDVVPMRQECKHFESRTYANGDTVRKCDLDLAPDAPWRCPDNCPKYERRLAAVAWTQGSLVAPPTPDEPASVADGTAAALLDEAEDYLNSVGDRVRAEVEAEQAAARRKGWRRLFRRG